VIREHGYTCYACAIMPDHVHALIRKHRDHAEVIAHLQEKSRQALQDVGRRPPAHPVWGAGPGWKVFLNTRGDMERIVEYIQQNPLEAGRPEQGWPFVKEYNGWMPACRG
jgi:REP element-mobilizing transposase RayT